MHPGKWVNPSVGISIQNVVDRSQKVQRALRGPVEVHDVVDIPSIANMLIEVVAVHIEIVDAVNKNTGLYANQVTSSPLETTRRDIRRGLSRIYPLSRVMDSDRVIAVARHAIKNIPVKLDMHRSGMRHREPDHCEQRNNSIFEFRDHLKNFTKRNC